MDEQPSAASASEAAGTIRHQIKSISGAVLFEAEVSAETPSGLIVRAALEQATKKGADLRGADLRGADLSGADLRGADLRGADLSGADLSGADLSGADLRGADLRGAYLRGAYLSGADLSGAYLSGADLSGADLSGAYLRGAYLRGADLRGAYLRGAYLRGKKLVGERPILQIGPIGSRADYLVAYLTDSGVMLAAGCFFGTVEEFEDACAETHGDNQHGREYAAALAMVRAHAEIWTPKVEKPAAEVAVEG